MYFSEVDLIDLKSINWKIRFDRNNQTYKMLIGLCYLAIEGLLQTASNGEVKLMEFIDDQRMSRLYEKFVLNYYIREHPEISASSSQIKWQLDDFNDFMLPKMQSDVYLEYENNVLIIDTKYYSHTTQSYWDAHSTQAIYIKFSLMLKIKKGSFKEKTIWCLECYFMQGLLKVFNRIMTT